MLEPGRSFQAANSTPYRFSINGQENSDEIAPNTTTAEYWEYDARIGRRWNVDPVVKDDESPYMTFGNNPVALVDPNGDDWYHKNGDKNADNLKWFDGSGKQKGYSRDKRGTNFWTARNKKDVSVWYGSSADDVQMAGSSLDPVVVKSSKPGKPAPVQWLGGAYGGSNWNYTHGDVVKWNDQRATVWGRLDAGQLPIVNGDDPELIANSNSYFLEWKARNEWRSMNYLVWDFTTMCIPLPKVGMLRWLKYGGRTFKEAKALIWLKNTRPIFQKIVNEETGQTFKVFAEIHHKYIPQRWNLPNWLTNATWNLQITNSIEHAVMDPYRYQFLPKWVKEGIEAGEISGESVLRVK